MFPTTYSLNTLHKISKCLMFLHSNLCVIKCVVCSPPQQRPTHSKTRGRVPFLKGGRNVRVNTHAYTHHVIWCDRILIHHKMTHQPFILPCQQTVIQFGGTHNTGQLKIRITPIFMRLDVRLDAYPLNEYINSKISTHQ